MAYPSQYSSGVSAGQRCAVQKVTSPLCRPRNKRYNTLDLASKIVCQRKASPPSFGNLQGTGDRIFSREIEKLFAGIHFPPFAAKTKRRFCRSGENEKRINASKHVH